MVARSLSEKLQDANVSHPQPTRLPPRRLRRLPALHYIAAAERPVEDALLPRRGPLGAQTAKLPALVQDRQRLGRSVHEAATMSFKPRKKPESLDEAQLYEYAVAALGRRMRTVTELKRLMRNRVEEGETGATKIIAVVHRL